MFFPHVSRAATTAVLVALAACGDAITSGGRAPVSVSFSSSRSGASPSLTPSTTQVPITSGGHTLDLTAASLLVSKLEFETASGADVNQECDEGHGCSSVLPQPITVDLNTGGGVVTVTAGMIPAGSYREIEVKVSSVRLRGTYDTQAFDVTLPVSVEREMEFNPPLVVGGTGDTRNVTISVPVATWLTNPDGSLVDPRALATNATLRAAVISRINASLRAFHDDDRDGNDDDH